jgi:hypothetical protein
MAKSKKKVGLLTLVTFGTISFVIVLVLAFLFFPSANYSSGFSILSDIEKYSKGIDEWIKMEDENVLRPNYAKFYNENYTYTFLEKTKGKLFYLLGRIGLFRDPIFSRSFFKNILVKLADERKKKKWKGIFVQKANYGKVSKIVVFGAIQGAFHGMLRYLKKLKELNIIDEDLKLKNKNYFLVFLGHVVHRCPWTLEILAIVMRLMEMNPENVIYLRGTSEYPKTWRQHTLGTELEARIERTGQEEIPLEAEIDNFFDTLPYGIYFSLPADGEYFKVIPYIHDENAKKSVDEKSYPLFVSKKQEGTLQSLVLTEKHEYSEDFNLKLKAVVKDIRKRDNYEAMDGLRLLNPIDGVTAWTVLSTAAETYRIGLKHFYEGFVVISTEGEIEDSTITLYNRDVRQKDDLIFKIRKSNFFSGQDK